MVSLTIRYIQLTAVNNLSLGKAKKAECTLALSVGSTQFNPPTKNENQNRRIAQGH